MKQNYRLTVAGGINKRNETGRQKTGESDDLQQQEKKTTTIMKGERKVKIEMKLNKR